jgi:hypothetical protein
MEDDMTIIELVALYVAVSVAVGLLICRIIDVGMNS